ncbi:hypothetical protein Tco_1423034 [Tanacetum coccineum]
MMRLFRSDDKFSQMLDQFESSPEFGGASASGGCRDYEPGGDEDGDEDEEDGDRKSSTMAVNSLAETMQAPPSHSGKLPRKVSLASFPLQLIPDDMSLGIAIPSDKSPEKAWNWMHLPSQSVATTLSSNSAELFAMMPEDFAMLLEVYMKLL